MGMTKSIESKSEENLDVIRPLSVTWKNGRGAPITFLKKVECSCFARQGGSGGREGWSGAYYRVQEICRAAERAAYIV